MTAEERARQPDEQARSGDGTAGPAIVLVDPQLGENIGMAARAMLNCGLDDLRIVRPRDGWPSAKARDAAAGADGVIDTARVFETTAEAIADLARVYATTGRSRELVTRLLTPREAAAEMRREAVAGAPCGVLFGGERSGLANEDVSRSDAVIRVPLNPDFKSLNLAQAVLLVAYEWFCDDDETPGEVLDANMSRPATKEELDNFVERLGGALDAGGFFRAPAMRPGVMRNIRALFARTRPSEQEIRTLFGVVAAVKRAGARDGRAAPPSRNREES